MLRVNVTPPAAAAWPGHTPASPRASPIIITTAKIRLGITLRNISTLPSTGPIIAEAYFTRQCAADRGGGGLILPWSGRVVGLGPLPRPLPNPEKNRPRRRGRPPHLPSRCLAEGRA